MRPDIWGPTTWTLLHCITLEYPDNPTKEDKENIKNFINCLGLVLPCEKCKMNFKSHLEELPLTDEVLRSKKNFVKWMIDVHNSVNKMNGKKELSYHDALKNILISCNKNNTFDIKNILIIIMVIIIMILSILLFYKCYSNS